MKRKNESLPPIILQKNFNCLMRGSKRIVETILPQDKGRTFVGTGGMFIITLSGFAFTTVWMRSKP
jgi:hypothetical protein